MLTRSNMHSVLGRRARFALFALALAAIVVVTGSGPTAQTPAVQTSSPFDVIGFIQAATLDNPGDVFSGGTITVNGARIIVPRYTILQMPAAALSWQEVFKLAPAPWGPTQSGLALTDTPQPPITYEVRVQGNRVVTDAGDQFIAGLIFIAQQSLNVGAGFINYIDYATGVLRVGGVINDPSTGSRVAINDPPRRYRHAPAASSPDVRFMIDEDNPTVRSETAYPMCVPTSPTGDPQCPLANRPKDALGNFATIFTMAPPGRGPSDPTKMAPFEVGDYVTYNGNLLTDASGPYIAAWSVIANVGIFTAPRSQPTYVAIDVMLLGTGGIPIPGLPQEAAVRTRVEGFTTDPTALVDIFAVDVDPCTGEESDRFYATIAPDQRLVLGRWRWRPSTLADFLPPSREIRARTHNGVVATPVANGLGAGEYTAPDFEFIFPENLGIGNPPVPLNFQDFPFLAHGEGPYLGGGPNPSAVSLGRTGQLSPWPGSPAPQPVACGGPSNTTQTAPVANAGPSQTVLPSTLVTLDGTLSRDTNIPTLPLSYSWAQKSGPALTAPGLIGATSPRPTFSAPALPIGAPPVTFVFTLTVKNTAGLTSSADVTVTASAPVVPADTITVPTATFRVRRSRLTVNATTDNPTAVLSVQGFGIMSPTIPPVPGNFQMIIVGLTPIPSSVTVTSNLGGSITVPVTVIP